MKFGLMFFAADDARRGADRYRLLLAAARFADEAEFVCVWTPERHFDRFGGSYPNPALASAALAVVTRRVQLRAGSVVPALHDSVRLVEDWSMVDNLSGGRVALSFACGWNPDDFALAPERFADRREALPSRIAEIRALWRTQRAVRVNGAGERLALALFPAPLQPELPVWMTTASAPTFEQAGTIGANLLTHLVSQDLAALPAKIAAYRAARARSGLAPHEGIVSLMLHTFVGERAEDARERARGPLGAYLRASLALELAGRRDELGDDDLGEALGEMLELRLESYLDGNALIGTAASCRPLLGRLAQMGVDEIACLIDFGLPDDEVLAGLRPLRALAAEHG